MADHRLEEKIAHLERTVEELSETVAGQDRALAELGRRVAMLMQRAAEAEAEAGGSVLLADPPPPHY